MEYLGSTAYILLALLGFGFVIFVHELGHFTFAKLAGVRVEVFSIGFGPVLLKTKWRGTEWALCLLPFGGYVKMLGQEDVPQGKEAAAPTPDSYLAKHAGWKSLILLGGVLFNLVSSWILLFGLALAGMPRFAPVVGEVRDTVRDRTGAEIASPARRLGLRMGDRITAVDGDPMRSFEDVAMAAMFAGGRPISITVERDGREVTLPGPGQPPVEPVYDRALGRASLGIEFPSSNRLVAVGGAEADGPRPLDRVLAVAGEDVTALTGQQIAARLLRHVGTPVPVRLRAPDGGEREILLRYAGEGGAPETELGLPVRLRQPEPGSPAAAAGIKAGDLVVRVGPTKVAGTTHFLGLVRAPLDRDEEVALGLLRDGVEVEVRLRGVERGGMRRLGLPLETVGQGVLPQLAAGLDGGPGALAAAGVRPGEALLAVEASATAGSVVVHVLPPGERLVLPIATDTATWNGLCAPPAPPLWARIIGRRPGTGLDRQLVGRQVVAVDDGMGQPTGSPVPGHLTLGLQPGNPALPAIVDLRPLGDGLAPLLAGLKAGDWITATTTLADGRPALEVVRGAGPPRAVTVATRPVGVALVFDREELPAPPAASLGEAAGTVNATAANLVFKTLTLFPRFFRPPEQGGVDPNKSLSGPIGIFRVLKHSAERWGIDSYLKLLALVGLNLFLVNLLPIPITDGGQLVILGIESALRRPIPDWLRNGLAWAGFGLVVVLFLYVSGLDVLRWTGLM